MEWNLWKVSEIENKFKFYCFPSREIVWQMSGTRDIQLNEFQWIFVIFLNFFDFIAHLIWNFATCNKLLYLPTRETNYWRLWRMRWKAQKAPNLNLITTSALKRAFPRNSLSCGWKALTNKWSILLIRWQDQVNVFVIIFQFVKRFFNDFPENIKNILFFKKTTKIRKLFSCFEKHSVYEIEFKHLHLLSFLSILECRARLFLQT